MNGSNSSLFVEQTAGKMGMIVCLAFRQGRIMSTATTTRKASRTPDDDEEELFRFGWRYVVRQLPGGKEIQDQVPLTLKDLLHPKEGDVYVENSAHERDRRYL